MPNVIGALDGKHVAIECPSGGGSLYYNYKHFHSTVLMAVCDADYRFLSLSIGSYGSENDAGIFKHSSFIRKFDHGVHDLPPPTQHGQYSIPYYLVGDEIFPLTSWLMKPWPGKNLSQEQQVFNYRLSRSRRTIENTFGILCARWRIFRRPIHAKLDLVDLIVQACVCLHNYLMLTDNASYKPTGFVDSYSDTGDLIEGDWRKEVTEGGGALGRLRPRPLKHTYTAKEIRECLTRYVNSPEAALPWQVQLVTSTGKRQHGDTVQ
ncbi:uncharacterized protein [Watersipora subatra]|uniref:uncharacterized protein n=1 Tax=Watersipora subatra TaxID=2589382 RepID=UPI00355C041C